MRFSKVISTGVVVATLVFAVSTNKASAEWTDKSGSLPGLTSGGTIGLVAGIGGAAVVAAYLYHRHHKAPPMPVQFPPRVTFGPATESTVTFQATTDTINLSEMRISGKGFSVVGGGPPLPLLLKPGEEPLELHLARTATASRGTLDVTFLDAKGKAHTSVVALLARGK
jgi:hypothetical protein